MCAAPSLFIPIFAELIGWLFITGASSYHGLSSRVLHPTLVYHHGCFILPWFTITGASSYPDLPSRVLHPTLVLPPQVLHPTLVLPPRVLHPTLVYHYGCFILPWFTIMGASSYTCLPLDFELYSHIYDLASMILLCNSIHYFQTHPQVVEVSALMMKLSSWQIQICMKPLLDKWLIS